MFRDFSCSIVEAVIKNIECKTHLNDNHHTSQNKNNKILCLVSIFQNINVKLTNFISNSCKGKKNSENERRRNIQEKVSD